MPTVIDRYDTLRCNGGRRVGQLASANDGGGNLLGGSQITLSQDHRDECTIVTDKARALACSMREVVRITESSGDISEWIVRRIVTSHRDTATIVADPAWMLLATSRAVRAGSFLYTNRITITDTPENILTTFLTAFASEDGYGWLTLGTIEPDNLITLDIDITSPLGLIHAVVAAIPDGAIWQITRNGDAGYLLHLYHTLPYNTVRAAIGDDITSFLFEQDTKDTITVVQPVGRDTGAGRVSIAEAAWRVTTVTPSTLTVADPGTGMSPFVALNQGSGWYVRRGLTTWGVIMSSTINGMLTMENGTAGLAVDDIITFDSDVFGRPVVMLDIFAATLQYGFIYRTLRGDWRDERSLLRNPRLTGTASPWSSVNGSSAIVIPRDQLDVTLTGAAAGARAAATGTGTPFTTDGWLPGQPFYRMDTIEVDAANLDITADAIPDATGAMTVTVAGPGLPAAYADESELTLVRRDVRALEVDGAQTPAFPVKTLLFRDVQTDGLGASGELFNGARLEGFGWSIAPTFSYLNGLAGKITAFWNSAQQFGSVPASFTDGQVVTLSIPHETRVLRLNGAHSAGATTLSFEPVAALATRHFLTDDVVNLSREMGGSLNVTAIVDNMDGTISATFHAASSTLDDVTAVDRDGLARMFITGEFHVEDDIGDFYDFPQVEYTLVSINLGTSVALLQFSGNGYTLAAPGTYDQSQPVDAAWTIENEHTLASGANWGSNGRATLPVTVPSGRVIPRGTHVGANWHYPAIAGSMIFVHADAVGPTSTVEVAGWDGYTSTWDGVTAMPTAVYRVFASGSRLDVAGNTLVLAANAVADGAGVASLTLSAANVNAINDLAPLSLTRPALVPVTSPTTGSMIRLTSAVTGTGEPTLATQGAHTEPVVVRVDEGSTRIVTFWASFALSGPEQLTPGDGPVVAIIANGVLVEYAALEKTTVFGQALNTVTMLVSTVLTATSTVEGRAYGGSSTLANRWHMVDMGNLYAGTDELLPIADSPPANFGWHAANRELAARAQPLQSVSITRRNAKGALKRAWELPIKVGTRVIVEGTTFDARAVSTVRDLVDDHNTSVVLSTDTERLTQKLVSSGV